MDLNFIDIFGIGIGLRYLNKEEYQTKFGAFITVIISALVGVQIFLVGSELFVKANPDVIYAERFVASPARFNITRKNFNFAFGAQFPGNFSQFIDESIYTVTAEQVAMHKKYNETTGEYYQDWQTLPIGIHPCTSKDFEVEESLDYFNTLAGVENMYCLDYDSQDLYIQGNFDQDDYGLIQMKFRLCSGQPNCRSPDEIKSIMTNSFVAHYTNDIVINPKNINPYSLISRDMYWSTNPFYPKDAYLYYRNNYVESDEGIFFEQSSYQKMPALSYLQEEIIFGETDYFFAMYIRFEKAKESVYHRKYKKLDSVLAEIGGIAKALVIIGYLICMPVNQLKLHQQLSNSLFNFRKANSKKNEEEKKKSEMDEEEEDEQGKQNQKIVGQNLVQIIQAQQEMNKNQFSQNNLNNVQVTSQRQLLNRDFSQNPVSATRIPQFDSNNQIFTQRESKFTPRDAVLLKNNNPSIDQKQVTLQFHNNEDEYNQTKKQHQTEPSEAINAYAKEQPINNNNATIEKQKQPTSGINLLKMIQMKKQMKQTSKQQSQQVIEHPESPTKRGGGGNQLKRTQSAINVKNLFNQNNKKKEDDDNTLKLEWTDYIRYYLWPFGEYAKKKKQIDYSVEKIYQHLDMLYIVQKLLELEKLKQVLLTEDQQKLIQFFPKPEIDVDEIDSEKVDKEKLQKQRTQAQHRRTSKRHKSGINLLNDHTLDEKGKAKEAFQALKNIIKKQHLTEVDKKIIEMLDESILEHIENNVDYLQDLEEKDEILARQNPHQFNENEEYHNEYRDQRSQQDFYSMNNNHKVKPVATEMGIRSTNKNEKVNISIESSGSGSVEKQPASEKDYGDGQVQQINQFMSIENTFQQNNNNIGVLQSFKNIGSKQQSDNRLPVSITKIS